MAPECHASPAGAKYTSKIDVFSFAILAWEVPRYSPRHAPPVYTCLAEIGPPLLGAQVLARRRAYDTDPQTEFMSMDQICHAGATALFIPTVISAIEIDF